MRSLKVIAVLVPLLVAVGCAKKTAKKSAPAADEPTAAKVQPQPKPSGGATAGGGKADEKGDGPNWLGDDRFKDKTAPALPVETPGGGGKPGWGGAGGPPPGGWTAPVGGVTATPTGPAGPGPIHTPAPPGPGGTVPDARPPAGTGTSTTPTGYKPVTEADMKEIWVFVENRSGASGKMPTKQDIYDALVAASYTSGALVKDGSITLTGATTRESIWAYETKALTSGGLVCNQNGVETLTAAELRKRLGK